MGLASRWARFAACALDMVVLAAIGAVLAVAFFEPLSAIGAWGRLIGVAIAGAYFGVCDSRWGAGQSLGKRALKIRVVIEQGGSLPVGRAVLRFALLATPYFLGGIVLGPENRFAALGLWLLTAGAGLVLIYLFLFNRATGQSAHDRITHALVLRADAGVPADLPPVWRGHYVVCALLVLLSFAVPLMQQRLLDRLFDGQRMQQLYTQLIAEPEVEWAWIERSRRHGAGAAGAGGEALTLQVRLTPGLGCPRPVVDRLARDAFDVYPGDALDVLAIQCLRRVDLGIFEFNRTTGFYWPVGEWRRQLGDMAIKGGRPRPNEPPAGDAEPTSAQ